jgi:hypothetical protein
LRLRGVGIREPDPLPLGRQRTHAIQESEVEKSSLDPSQLGTSFNIEPIFFHCNGDQAKELFAEVRKMASR